MYQLSLPEGKVYLYLEPAPVNVPVSGLFISPWSLSANKQLNVDWVCIIEPLVTQVWDAHLPNGFAASSERMIATDVFTVSAGDFPLQANLFAT